MRRSASPSKIKKDSTPSSRPLRRSEDSSAVLKAAFKPLTGLEVRRNVSQPAKPSSASAPEPRTQAESSPSRDVRARTVAELEEEIADMELILSDRLKAHNEARKAQNLSEQKPEHIVAEYITLLTQYNKVKDATELIFDKIADIEQLPAKDIHARYGVGEAESSA